MIVDKKRILENMEMLDNRECQESNRRHDLLLFEQDLADWRRWRHMKCNKMLEQINQMLQRELSRRIKADNASNKEANISPQSA
jgi:hypothetical protein